jgi:mannose-6-phosphate isomerase class I
MKYLFSGESNYDKFPFINVDGYEKECFTGWEEIGRQIKNYCEKDPRGKIMIVAECYTGVYDTVANELQKAINPEHFFNTAVAFKTTQEIDRMEYPDVTNDEVFGFLTKLNLADFFEEMKLAAIRKKISDISEGSILIYGPGAFFLAEADVKIYFDMPRREAQLRFRRDEVSNLGTDNKTEKASLQYKRAFFVDWRVCDRHKKIVMPNCDFIIDTIDPEMPKMISQKAFRQGLSRSVNRPFRVVPFFDPGPWGGQWMKEVCDLDNEVENYAWCFDCVPEENSLMFKFGDILFETPAINLVFFKPVELLGTAVYGRFGNEFPIRFDFLDTMDGGNLSLQVHPLTEYIQEKFGFPYTQDESYYLMDTGEDACVYLGLKEDIEHGEMISDLKTSIESGIFDAEKYVEKWKVKKHDHLLIPAGTVHWSGANSMVLEISATPYIFTFKLWDWDRMGLDGRPRPINIDHGEKQIQWDRTTNWTKDNLVNQIVTIAEGDGWKEEKTGLHEYEFIETRRHWFSKKVTHSTNGGVNVLNLVEGAEVIVESETGEFEPFVVHYAETFIIPASVKNYTIRPYGKSEGKDCATIKAFVRNKA